MKKPLTPEKRAAMAKTCRWSLRQTAINRLNIPYFRCEWTCSACGAVKESLYYAAVAKPEGDLDPIRSFGCYFSEKK